jgi:hypothetical protein
MGNHDFAIESNGCVASSYISRDSCQGSARYCGTRRESRGRVFHITFHVLKKCDGAAERIEPNDHRRKTGGQKFVEIREHFFLSMSAESRLSRYHQLRKRNTHCIPLRHTAQPENITSEDRDGNDGELEGQCESLGRKEKEGVAYTVTRRSFYAREPPTSHVFGRAAPMCAHGFFSTLKPPPLFLRPAGNTPFC